MINISQISAQNNPQINLINIFTLKSVSTNEVTDAFTKCRQTFGLPIIKEMVMRKKAAPKKFNVFKEWRPDNLSIDQGSNDVTPGSKYKLGAPAIIDGKPFIWTALDSEMVRNICSKPAPNKKAIQDFIRDGMNENDSESFNW